MKIIVAVDSFKGTMSSKEISSIIKARYHDPSYHVEPIPISDGGEGFLDVLTQFYNEPLSFFETVGPLNHPIVAPYLLHGHTAYIELAQVSGLDKIKKDELNPLKTSTYGLGLLVKEAILKGALKIVLGIGGSATNDGGAGFLQALGVKFYHHDTLIESPMTGETLAQITRFDDRELKQLTQTIDFELATDVTNPLLGFQGSTHVYAPQKGADESIKQTLEENMTHYASIVEETYQTVTRFQEGAGAAGGFGFGAMTFLKARVHRGIEYIIHLLHLEQKIQEADIVFVGEGRFDDQTAYGKAPYGIAKIAKKYGKKVIGIFATSDDNVRFDWMDETYVIVPKYADQITSMEHPETALKSMLNHIKV
jgi:glycerate 2-kinase